MLPAEHSSKAEDAENQTPIAAVLFRGAHVTGTSSLSPPLLSPPDGGSFREEDTDVDERLPCAARVVPIARQALHAATRMIHGVAAPARRAPFEGAFRAQRAEHRRAVGRGAVVPRPVRQAGAGAVGVMARPGPAAIARA